MKTDNEAALKNDAALKNLDEYGRKIFIIPAEVKGFFRKRRDWVNFILLLVFLFLPWVRINGNQALLFNIPERRFSIFGVLFLAHDGPLLVFILALGTLGLTLVTAVWGRVWCGWACPQTVFIDFVYRRIERWIEGDYIQRRRLRQEEFSFSKGVKFTFKWFLYLVVSSLIAHCFVAYFTGAKELMSMIHSSPFENSNENWHYFLFVSVMTLGLAFNFGWFREQFCIIMCPYGRFQSVLMDRDSLAVYYDKKRGEPRKGSVSQGSSGTSGSSAAQGDCVSCRRCVEVCPTGIDIRDGVQMECIACTACIDACNDIMAKVKKPADLIRYSALSGKNRRIFRPRVVVYLILILISIGGLTYNFVTRSNFSALVLRSKDVPYTEVTTDKGPRILNHFMVHLHNQTFESQKLKVLAISEWNSLGINLTIPKSEFEVNSGGEAMAHFFVTLPKEVLGGHGKLQTFILIQKGEEEKRIPVTLIGP